MNKRGWEFSFGWIFAIIVGAAILSLGLYAASKIVKQGEYKGDSLSARELGLLTTALETGLESGKTDKISFDIPTRVVFDCDLQGFYGVQKISIGRPGKDTGIPSQFSGKYFFSGKDFVAKDILVLGKPFDYPFRVADVLILWSSDSSYCFLDPPEQMEKEIKSLVKDNRAINSSLQVLSYDKKESCKRGSQKVCFGKVTGCDISVYESLIKKGSRTIYVDSSQNNNVFVWAGIFSDPDVYECQFKRLMKRASSLSSLYQEKSILLNGKGCTSSLTGSLESFSQATRLYNSSSDLAKISFLSQSLGGENDKLSCPVF
ncbi:hypothetical protein FJZ18_04275 [Candidatus Pacearchaeota archaeon]|nr:hypothetical protein [Candidatus Pacearchaeota archaeon]